MHIIGICCVFIPRLLLPPQHPEGSPSDLDLPDFRPKLRTLAGGNLLVFPQAMMAIVYHAVRGGKKTQTRAHSMVAGEGKPGNTRPERQFADDNRQYTSDSVSNSHSLLRPAEIHSDVREQEGPDHPENDPLQVHGLQGVGAVELAPLGIIRFSSAFSSDVMDRRGASRTKPRERERGEGC